MIHKIIEVIIPHIIIFAGLYIAVFLAILADLFSGYRKAKKSGFLRSSKGLRRTVKKVAEYYNLMFVVSIIDCVQMVAIFEGGFDIPKMPFFSFLATIFLCIIELKSIYERKTDKERAEIESMAKFLVKAAKDKDTKEVINMLSEIFEDK